MFKHAALLILALLLFCSGAFAQGPCSIQSSALACVLPQEYGANPNRAFTQVLYDYPGPPKYQDGHPFHFINEFGTTLKPLTADIGRQANLLPLASPSSGIILVFDPTLKTLVTSTDSLGPILGERAETVGRHRLFLGFSYQFFNFDKIDGVNLNSFPAILPHTDDNRDNSAPAPAPAILCSTNGAVNGPSNLNGCGFIRDRIDTMNSISLKVNQYTSYITYGLTKRIDISMVIPVETVRLSLYSQDTMVPGTSGFITPTPGSPDSMAFNQNGLTNGAPYFFHLFKNCPNASPASGVTGLDPACLNHTFPDFSFTGSGSQPKNVATGIGDVVARIKWNAWEGEHAGFAAGMDVRFPTGDALNYLGSGSWGYKPFAIFSYRARVSPHILVGYEWNTNSITAGDVTTGVKGTVPNDFVYIVGADAWVTKWLTGAFDIVGQRVFSTETVSITQQQFLGNCGSCATGSNTANITQPNLLTSTNQSYNITNASMGIKVRPFPSISKLVITANVLVRLDDGGLRSKAAPLVGVGYTF
jgi:hypothetical protein